MQSTIHPVLSQLKQSLIHLYGDRLCHLTLFGSQARGDNDSDSDIDVLVVLRSMVNVGEEVKRTGKIVADLSLQNEVVISCLFMDEDHYTARNSPLLHNIRQEGVTL